MLPSRKAKTARPPKGTKTTKRTKTPAKPKGAKERTTSLSIYLLEPGATLNDAFNNRTTLHEEQLTSSLPYPARLVTCAGTENTPKWVKYLAPAVAPGQPTIAPNPGGPPCLVDLKNRSARAALALEIDSRVFVIPFGTANYHLLNESLIVRNFGLRVALNAVAPDELRSLDTKTVDAIVLDVRKQASKTSSKTSFHLDEDRDLLRCVVGAANKGVLDSRLVIGRDALKSSFPGGLTELGDHCRELLDLYSRDDYKANGFDFVDRISQVRDTQILAQLNSELQAKVRNRDLDAINFTPPEILDWERVDGVKFKGNSAVVAELDLEEYLDILEMRAVEFATTDAMDEKVWFVDGDGVRIKSWSIYRCLHAELELAGTNNDRYVLSDGLWYQVAADFAADLRAYVRGLDCHAVDLPDWDGGEEKFFNILAAKSGDLLLFDRRMLKPTGGGRSTVEACDLYCPTGKLIHVKSAHKSSDLSHLFAQGFVAAELLFDDEGFRRQFRNKIRPAAHRKHIPLRKKPKAEDLTLVYVLLRKNDKGTWPECLPFFSLLNLRSHVQKLRARNLNVAVQRVTKTSSHSSKTGAVSKSLTPKASTRRTAGRKGEAQNKSAKAI